MELIHWQIGDYSDFGYFDWQVQIYVAEGSLDHQGSLFLCSAPLPQKKREGGGHVSHVQIPVNETQCFLQVQIPEMAKFTRR